MLTLSGAALPIQVSPSNCAPLLGSTLKISGTIQFPVGTSIS
jgi:hypothetical protein